MNRTTGAPGGNLLEQGRWLIDHGKRKEAATLLADFGKRFPRSANVAEAQYLAHKARFYDALDMLNIEGAANRAAGLAALEALAAEPYDFPVAAAKFAKAIVVFAEGRQDEAERAALAALDEWRSRQKLQEPASVLERDVVAIRSAVFLPMGGGIYQAARGWNAFSWLKTPKPFLVVNPEVGVTFAGAPATRVSLPQRFPGLDNVVQLTTEHLGFFNEMLNKLGGTKKRQPQNVMETPNQPAGPSVNIIGFIGRLFEARPGHWGGWEFLTYPVISEIEFLDSGRTKARAKVTIGYSGCDVLLEKADGAWSAVRLANFWVT